MNRLFKISMFLALGSLAFTGSAEAAFYYWNLATGDGFVNDGSLWSAQDGITTGIVPGAGDLAIVRNAGVVKIDADHLFAGVPNDIWVGDGSPTTGWPNAPFDPGEGHVLQTGGVVNYGYWFLVGRANAPGTSTYDLQSGSIVQTASGGQFVIGEWGSTATMTVGNNASITVNDAARIGVNAGAVGTLTMSGASTATFAHMDLGWESGDGSIILSDSAVLTSGNWSNFGVNNATASLTMSGNSVYNGNYGRPGGQAGSTVTWNMSGNARVNWQQWLNLGENNSVFTLTMNDNASIGTNSVDFGYGANANSTAVLNGTSSIQTNAVFNIGVYGENASGSVTLNDSASITVGGNLDMGLGATGALGVLTLNGSSTATVAGTINLGSGGGSGQINFNGGTLKATGNKNNFIADGSTTPGQSVFVQAGGATIDTNGFDVVVATPLLEDALSTGGGLTKNSAGQLVLASGYNTYTGTTAVNAGSLAAHTADPWGASSFGPITVAADAAIMPAVWDSMNNVIDTGIGGAVILKTSALTLADGSGATFVISDGAGLSSINVTGALTAGGGNATVVTDFIGNVPWAGSYQIVGYGSKTGTITFLPKVDGVGTLGVNIVDDGMASISAVFADMNTWNTAGPSNNYNNVGNWSLHVPNTSARRALFAGTGETVTLDVNATVSSLNFDGTDYVIAASGANKFTMNSSIALNAHINNVSGSNTISAPIDLAKDTRATVVQDTDTLTLSGAIGGAGGIEKVGDGTLAMASLGSGPAGDLVLGGGTFRYIGTTATTARGLVLDAAMTVDVESVDTTLTMT
ncbi:MAG TPA: hypothetical protein DD670_19560, partial [Planctomycetaceae bacterium]|nr:hypothetical protein [Planctomycetaceae bacterium]